MKKWWRYVEIVFAVLVIIGIVFLGFNLIKNNKLKINTSSEFPGYSLKLFNEMDLRKYLKSVRIEGGLNYEGKQIVPKTIEVVLTNKKQYINIEQPLKMEAVGSVGLVWNETNRELKIVIQSMPTLWEREDGNRHVAAQFLRIVNSMVQKESQRNDADLFMEYANKPVFFIIQDEK